MRNIGENMSTINIGALSETINNKADRDLKNRSIDSGFRKLVDSYSDDADWYKIYAEIQNDGTVKYWCEQGSRSATTSGYGTVVLLVPYIDTTYLVVTSQDYGTTVAPSYRYADIVAVDSKTTNEFRLIASANDDSALTGFASWVAFGYIELTVNNSDLREVTWVQPVPSGNIGGSTFAVYSDIETWQAHPIEQGFQGPDAVYAWFQSSDSFRSGNFIFYNPDPIKVTGLTFTNVNAENYSPASGEIYGSNDNTNWTLIKSYGASNNAANATWSVDISTNTSFYKYYKVTCDYTSGALGSLTGTGPWGFTNCRITATVMQ